MNPPKPDAQHRALAPLVGTFRGVESHMDDPPRIGTYTNQLILDGFFVSIDYSQTIDAVQQYGMRGVIGWDSQSERYFFHWYDSLGGHATTSRGGFVGETLQLAGPDNTHGGYTRFSWDFEESSQVVTIETSRDQQHWDVALRFEYQREA